MDPDSMELQPLGPSTEPVPYAAITSQNSLDGPEVESPIIVISSESSPIPVSSSAVIGADLSCATTQVNPGFVPEYNNHNHNIRPSIPTEPMMEFVDDMDNYDKLKRSLIETTLLVKAKNYKSSSPLCSIYSIPEKILQHHPHANLPKFVAIGVFHPSNESLSEEMWECKVRCLNVLISRHLNQNSNNSSHTPTTPILLQQCLEMMLVNADRIRSYFNEGEYKVKDAEAMTYDCSFILYLLLQLPQVEVYDGLWIWKIVKYDLLLLEFQVPFFLLYELRHILGTVEDNKVDLIERALDFFRDIDLYGSGSRKGSFLSRIAKEQRPSPIHVHHLLHLFYLSLLPSFAFSQPEKHEPAGSEKGQVWIPSATNLTELGVQFIIKKKYESFLDVNFTRRGITRKGVVEIPPLLFGDNSRDLFCNLIAFEQCYPHTKCHITAYAIFMDCLINTEKDIKLLHSTGILTNRMSANQELTQFFSRITINSGIYLSLDQFYLADLFRDVNRSQEDKWNKSWAGFMHAYCSNMWAVFAAVVGIVLFVLTFLQTFYTIFPYYNPRG